MTTVLFSLLLAQSAGLPIRVEGDGFLRFMKEGRVVYTRSATLVARGGQVVHSSGIPLLPSVDGAIDGAVLTVDPNGDIKAGGRKLGRIILAVFPPDLRPVASGDFYIAADRPKAAFPGAEGAGRIVSGSSPSPSPRPAPAAAAPSFRVEVRPANEVEGDLIRLGDIASITGPEAMTVRLRSLELGTTPALGVSRTLDRSLIETRIARAGVLLTSVQIAMPDRSTVTRKGQKVTQSQFTQAAIDFLKKDLPAEITLEGAEPGPDMTVPLGELILKVDNASLIRDRASATVVVFVNGTKFNSRTIQLKAASPLFSIKPGQTVAIRVRSGGAVVGTQGKVRTVDPSKSQVTVETTTGALLTGTLAKDGVVEVVL
jgi:hypothetical protein